MSGNGCLPGGKQTSHGYIDLRRVQAFRDYNKSAVAFLPGRLRNLGDNYGSKFTTADESSPKKGRSGCRPFFREPLSTNLQILTQAAGFSLHILYQCTLKMLVLMAKVANR